MRISDWSSDVCSSDLHSKVAEWPNPLHRFLQCVTRAETGGLRSRAVDCRCDLYSSFSAHAGYSQAPPIADAFRRSVHHSLRDQVSCRRSEEHTSELQSLMSSSYAVLCLKKKNTKHTSTYNE